MTYLSQVHPLMFQVRSYNVYIHIPRDIEVRHLIVNADKFLILGNDCVLGVRIVVDRRVGRHFA